MNQPPVYAVDVQVGVLNYKLAQRPGSSPEVFAYLSGGPNGAGYYAMAVVEGASRLDPQNTQDNLVLGFSSVVIGQAKEIIQIYRSSQTQAQFSRAARESEQLYNSQYLVTAPTEQQSAAMSEELAKTLAANQDPAVAATPSEQPTTGASPVLDEVIVPNQDDPKPVKAPDLVKPAANSAFATHPLVFFENTGMGSVDRALGEAIIGINTVGGHTALVPSRNAYGYVFFTRPQLNLQESNISNDRKFYDLLSSSEDSIFRQIRCILDPRLQRGVVVGSSLPRETLRFAGYDPLPIRASFVDPASPFISVFTNTATSVSGFPDLQQNTFSSKPSLTKGSYLQADDIVDNNETLDIEVTFRNIHSNIIALLGYFWLHYNGGVFSGTLMRYIDYIANGWQDNQTRMWRLVMDQNKKTVRELAATGPGIMVSVPLGNRFDYNIDTPYNDQTKDVSLRFRFKGVEYYDPILVWEFNQTSIQFNHRLLPRNREKYFVRVPDLYRGLMNHSCYPLIDENTMELVWWADKEVFKARLAQAQGNGALQAIYPG